MSNALLFDYISVKEYLSHESIQMINIIINNDFLKRQFYNYQKHRRYTCTVFKCKIQKKLRFTGS